MNYKIICESASNVYKYKDIPFLCIPAIMETSVSRYYDDRGLNVSLMLEQMNACPNEIEIQFPSVKQWFDACNHDIHFLVCNSSLLSDSYANAILAKNKVEALHPNKKVYVINTNTTGPSMQLIIEKLVALLKQEEDSDTIYQKMIEYTQNIRVLIASSKPSSHIKKQAISKFNGFMNTMGFPLVSSLRKNKVCTNTLTSIVHALTKNGFSGNRLIVSHHQNEEAIALLKNMLYKTFGPIQVDIVNSSGINAYLFGKDAILIGYEG